MSDLLCMDYINSLPQPFLARFCGDKVWWPVNDFEVGTGLMRIDVVGKLEVKRFSEVMEIQDGNGVILDPDTFYSDWVHRGPVESESIVDIDAQYAIEAFINFPRGQTERPRRAQ